MKRLLALLFLVAVAGDASAEVVFSNLNTSSSASVGSGFTWYAQRFTTVSSGTGFQLDMNFVAQTGSQPYSVELWSADVSGTTVSALLATIGSGTVTSTDKTAVTTFNSGYGLDAATNYFIKIVAATGNLGMPLGPSSSTTLNSILRYGVGNLNNTAPSLGLGMKVDVVAVPEPASAALVGMAACLGVAATAVGRGRAARRRESRRTVTA